MHPAHDKANRISIDIPEIAALYRSIGRRSYFDKGYEPQVCDIVPEWHDGSIEEGIQIKKSQIDSILWELTYNEIENAPNTNHFKDAAVALAQQYVNLVWLHTPWMTSKILTQVLDSELVPLKKEALGSETPGRLTSLLPGAWGIVLPAILSLVYFAILLGGAVALFNNHYPILGLLAVAYMAWHFGRRIIFDLCIGRERKKLAELYAQLHLVREEVASGSFDSEEIDLRLHRFEVVGLYVHSLSHALLRLRRFPADKPAY